MRRILAVILMFLGMFLVVIGVLAQVYAPDRLERTPLDVHNVTHLAGTAELSGESVPIRVTSTTVTDSEASDDDVVVWKNSSCVVKDQNDVPDCVSSDDPDGRLISASEDEFATHRVTGLAVTGSAYVPDSMHEGLINKWPFNAEKKTYPYWDDTTGSAQDAVFDRTEDLDGVEVYVYKMTIDATPAPITDDVDGIYSANTEFWVEPRTGDILNQIEDQTRTTTDGDPVLSIQAEFTDEQKQDSVESAKDNLASLDLLEKWVPIVGYVAGGICLIAGILLAAAGRRQEQTPGARKSRAEQVSV
ncbi:DUF3068 domain-containing protein [Nocardioides sp. YIM 152315]|nr:DUF3068 domain-containing protein [Nocardioides sp. YIM 152315]